MNQRGGRGFPDHRGRSPRPSAGRSPHNRSPAGAEGHLVDGFLVCTDGMFRDGRENSQQRSRGGASRHFDLKPVYRQKQPASSGSPGSQSSLSPPGSVSKPSKSADLVLACGDTQSVPKDVHQNASDLQNGDKTGYSASSEKVKVNVMAGQDESRLHSKSVIGVGNSLNKGTENNRENGSYGNSEQGGRTKPHHRPQGGVSKHFQPKPSSGNVYWQKKPAPRGGAGFSNVVKHQSSASRTSSVSEPSESADSIQARGNGFPVLSAQPVTKDARLGASEHENGDKLGYSASRQVESRLYSKSGAGVGDFLNKGTENTAENGDSGDSESGAVVGESLNNGLNNTKSIGDSGHSEDVEEIKVFDICPLKGGTSFKLKPSLLEKNKEKRRSLESHGSVLRPGMVLLKNFLSLNDQVKIVKQCRDLGKGSGGFYQPGYGDGRELHLKMMCLGKNWDPEKRKYGDLRPHDNTTPPEIPSLFNQLVRKAIEDSHDLIRKNQKLINVQNILPSMSPDICIVNFYTSSGRLGLHKDEDETTESRTKGLPVVSFSIGDSAEFLYGDERDVDKAEKVVLESGDLLIFGGKARHIFHGVASILPNTAPKALLDETNLRPGRLNLTFRKH